MIYLCGKLTICGGKWNVNIFWSQVEFRKEEISLL